MSMSSPIITSSMSLQCPSFTSSGWSKVEVISPPAHTGLHRVGSIAYKLQFTRQQLQSEGSGFDLAAGLSSTAAVSMVA